MKHVDFYGKRYIFFALSIALMLITLIASLPFALGVQLDIQFKGGSVLKYYHDATIDLEKAASVGATSTGTNVTALDASDTATGKRILTLNIAGDTALTVDQQKALIADLIAAFPDQNVVLSEANVVAPFLGREYLFRGMLAVLLASLLIIVYVAFRFKTIGGFSAGVFAVVALLHDCVLVFGVFVLLRIPVNDSLIAVVLTILGFSVNDTIVVYDRYRENYRLTGGKMPLPELMNVSINQTLARTINTTLTVFASITIVYVFATIYNLTSIRDFALPMMIGVISGAYSTIFIAGTSWVMWKTRKGEHLAPMAPPTPPPVPAMASGSKSKASKGKA
jgi:preprotein translocase subunit SecF